ncbi:MAG: hypothetical protein GX493_05990 [Firmicutes bacterium]|nr:hypothetical protein [Bacillota bacterium]
MEMRPQILLDVFWVLTLLTMGAVAAVLISATLRPTAAYWFTMLVCAAAVNIFGVVLTDLISPDDPLGLRAISIGRAFLPFCLLGFSLVFPYRRPWTRKRKPFFLLALPSLITLVITDPCFAPGDITYQLWLHVPWMGIYFLWAYLNLFFSYRQTTLRTTRRQHLLLSLATVPATAAHYTTSILLPAMGRNFWWRYNWLAILFSVILVLAYGIRYGLLRRYAKFSRSLLARSIDAAALSTQMVSHTVKNVLQLIRALAEQACGEEEAAARDHCRRIVAYCDELAERMNKLNLLARVRRESLSEEFFLDEPLERALERAAFRLASIEVKREYIKPIPKICGVRAHLEEVFFNLLVNAAEAMPEGGVIRLEIKIENDLAVVAVHDQGVGLTREQIPKIFEPFCSTKPAGTNWGIGLSYCYLVVESLGGELFVESVPGKGSCFFVVLPLPADSEKSCG